MANDLTNYENELARALKSAAQAQANIDRERLRLGKPLARKQFFTASEMKAELQAAAAREIQHSLVIIKALKQMYGHGDPADHRQYPVWDRKFFADRDSPRGRVEIAMMRTEIERWKRLGHDHAEEADPVDPGGGDNIVELRPRRSVDLATPEIIPQVCSEIPDLEKLNKSDKPQAIIPLRNS
jgi:hypothetical protein